MSEDNIDPFADAPPEIKNILDRMPPNLREEILARKREHEEAVQAQGLAFSEKLTDLIDQDAPDIIKRGLGYSVEHPEDSGAVTSLLALILGEHLQLKRDYARLLKDVDNLRKAHEAWVSDL